MPINMAGKNAPCPECRRIVRVPMPTVKQPTDWRKVNTGGPALAKPTNDDKLDGVWSTSTVEKVTGGELLRAGVIEEKREPRTRWQKIRLALFVMAVGGLLYGGFVGIRSYLAHSQEEKALQKALAAADNKDAPLEPLAAAEIFRAVGEFYARDGKVDAARQHFQKARGRLDDKAIAGSADRDALLFDIAVDQARLVLTLDEIKKAKHQKFAQEQQDKVMEDIKNTLQRIQSPDARLEAIRQIVRMLAGKQQIQRAPELAAPMVCGDSQAEALALVALERFRAQQTDDAGRLADLALETTKGPVVPAGKDDAKDKPSVVAPSLVAVWVLLKKPREKLASLGPESSLTWHLGQAEAAARENHFDAARAFAQDLQPLDQWRALAAIASIGLEQEPPLTTDAEQVAKWDATTVAEMIEKERKGKAPAKPDPSWLLLRLARQATAKNEELAKKLADAIPEPSLRGRARLDILRARLQHSRDSAPDDWANEVGPETSVYPLAREAVARHNARFAGSGNTLKAVDAWTPETLRPFGYVGAALGIQDSSR